MIQLFTVAFAGMLLWAGPAAAFWPKASYRQTTVVRGGWGGPVVIGGVPGFVGAPVVPVVGGIHQQGFLFGTGFTTGRQSFLYGDTDTTDLAQAILRQAVLRSDATPQAGPRSPGSPGPSSPPTPSTPSTTCPELSGRLDKIVTRLDDVQKTLTSIEGKVDTIVTVITQKQQEEQLKAIISQTVDQTIARLAPEIARQNQGLAEAIEILRKKERSADDERALNDLVKRLRGGK